MTWCYSQRSGAIRHDDEAIVGTGYSGAGAAKNDPDAETEHNRGPIPRGRYQMQLPRETPQHGPYAIPLAPSMDNQMFGRSEFLIHGDSIRDPGTASKGCIILDRDIRQQLWASGDTDLQVTE